jgi:hypothetical protein
MAARARRLAVVVLAATGTGACSQIGVNPEEPAAIELSSMTSPSIVIGDSLRDENGVAAPIRAIVRNIRGEVINDAPVTYVYAEFNRDSALIVDPVTGYVRAVRLPTGEARIAARVGTTLQVLQRISVTTRPDSLDRDGLPAITGLVTTLPDTTRASADANTSVPLGVVVRHIENETTVTTVANWVVFFSLVSPVNPGNDSTAAVFLVNDVGRASVVDTSNAQGIASRRVRIRAAEFPVGAAPDSVVVEARASYRGVELRGSPVRMVLPVQRAGSPDP